MSLVFERSRKKARLPTYGIMRKERGRHRSLGRQMGTRSHAAWKADLGISLYFILGAMGTREGFQMGEEHVVKFMFKNLL